MELPSSDIKKFLIFSYIPGNRPFQPKLEKSSLHFLIWNFLALIFKSFLYFLIRKLSYISGSGTLHFSAQARKNKKNPPRENFLYFRKRKP